MSRSRRGQRRDEGGQALVEFALVLPLVILLVSVAFNGWNGIQLDLRLTGAARAGVLVAANQLSTDVANNNGPPTPAQFQQALKAATDAINAEENTTVYQTSDPSHDYVSFTPAGGTMDTVTGIGGSGESTISFNVVTITISQAPVSLVPVIGNISVSAHASAEYS